MKRICLASIAFAALIASPALAADMRAPVMKAPPLPPAPIYTWTGCYIGGNVGWARTETRVEVTSTRTGKDDPKLSSDGFAGGGQLGCDYQFSSNWVIGIQGLVDATDFNHDHVDSLFTFHDRARWFATVTGRLGFLVAPSFLIYGKGGWGWVDHRFDIIAVDGTVFTGSTSGSRNGPDAGVGAEWMFTPNWSLWAEWDHIFLRNRDFVFTTNTVVNTVNVRRDFDKVLVGINWRFGGVAGPVRAAY